MLGAPRYTYDIDTAVARNSDDRVEGTEIHTDDTHNGGCTVYMELLAMITRCSGCEVSS